MYDIYLITISLPTPNGDILEPQLPTILHNLVPCGADGLLGDAHDATHGLIVHAHFVEDEEEGVISPFL